MPLRRSGLSCFYVGMYTAFLDDIGCSAPVSIIKLVSWRKPTAEIVIVGAYENYSGVQYRDSGLLSWLIT